MNTRFLLSFLMLFALIGVAHATVSTVFSDNFSDGDYTNNPTWEITDVLGFPGGTFDASSNSLVITSYGSEDLGQIKSDIQNPNFENVIDIYATFVVDSNDGGGDLFLGITEDANGSFNDAQATNTKGYWLGSSGQNVYLTESSAQNVFINIPYDFIVGQSYDLHAHRDADGITWHVFVDDIEIGSGTDAVGGSTFNYVGTEFCCSTITPLSSLDNILITTGEASGYVPQYATNDLPKIVVNGMGAMFVVVNNNLSAIIGLLVMGLIIAFFRRDLLGALKR